MKYIISYQEQNKSLCFNELKKLNANFKEIMPLNNEQSLVQINLPQQELSLTIKSTPLIFIRHLFAISKEYDKPIACEKIIGDIEQNTKKDQSFSIQFSTNINRLKCECNVQDLSQKLTSKGYTLNVKEPEQIVSMFETDAKIYMGFGNSVINLSSYKAGMPHFSKNFEFVSRAEYKLLEAVNLCNIDLSKMKNGADLGSAPGGWTKVLASNNINVHAIDPASLAPEIKQMPNVKHFRMTTEEYLRKYNYSNFDIVVNDMKMDIVLSTQIIMDFYDRIAPNGYIVMTFKLAKNFSYSNIMRCITTLTKKYKLILARQLFHNRSEITVVLQK